jgi:hypothetical protein
MQFSGTGMERREMQCLIASCRQESLDSGEVFFPSVYTCWVEAPHRLLSLARRHGVVPLIYKQMQAHVGSYPSLKPSLSLFAEAYHRIAYRNMLMSAELLRIVALLGEAGITARAFKGPALALLAYGDITMRQFGDLDLLVKVEDRQRAVAWMRQNGYLPEIMLKKSTEALFFASVNVLGFRNPSNGIRIELHWELFPKNYAVDWHAGRLWAAEGSLSLNHHPLPVLADKHRLLYLSIHGAKHLFERLEWVCDIDRVVRCMPKAAWAPLLEEAGQMGTMRMLCLGLECSRRFLGTPLPETVMQWIEKDPLLPVLVRKIVCHAYSKEVPQKRGHATFLLLWQMRERYSDRLRFAWRSIFSTKLDDFLWIQFSRKRAWLYLFVRPFRLWMKYSGHRDVK